MVMNCSQNFLRRDKRGQNDEENAQKSTLLSASHAESAMAACRPINTASGLSKMAAPEQGWIEVPRERLFYREKECKSRTFVKQV